MKKLIIAEKPSVARDFARCLSAAPVDNYFENDQYIISSCIGHLVKMSNPEAYDKIYENWKIENLPIIPENWVTEINPATKKQFLLLKQLATRPDVSEIVCATDAGREGELIYRLVMQHIPTEKPQFRFWTTSLEDAAIHQGLENLQPLAEYDDLYESALSRAKADWLVGMNATRLYTCKYASGTALNVGRVQTPTLNLIVERDFNIENFVPQIFYTLRAKIEGGEFETERIETEFEAKKKHEATNYQSGIIIRDDSATKIIKAPALHDLTGLQKIANKVLGLSAKETLDLLQLLYEKKIITYPRTDSRYITEDMSDKVLELLSSLPLPFTYSFDLPLAVTNIVNNKKVSDHHGLLPTHYSITTEGIENLNKLDDSAKKLYYLIYIRLIEACSSNAIQEVQTIELDINSVIFKKTISRFKDLGFKVVWSELKTVLGKITESASEEENVATHNLFLNQAIHNIETNIHEGETRPPKRFTEQSLLSAMEKAGTEDIEEDVEREGLGTPATRANIIENLIQRGYVERSTKKQLISTEKGRYLIKVMYPDLKSAKMTSDWENTLARMARGEESSTAFLSDIHVLINQLVANVSNDTTASFASEEKPTKEIVGRCPICNSHMYESTKSYYCSEKNCKTFLNKQQTYLSSSGKKLTKEMAKKLLTEGKTYVTGLTSVKSGKQYNAHIVIEINKVNDTHYLNVKPVFD
ncbi:DNA topoisomerase [Aerococcaceae bacterium NML190938]|nr:DNA topoisomerase [Aerococcaceae bacterium NML190938]